MAEPSYLTLPRGRDAEETMALHEAQMAPARAEVNESATTVAEAAAIYARHGLGESDAQLFARLHFAYHRDELKRAPAE